MNMAYKVLLMSAILLGRQGVMAQQKGEESSPMLRNLKGKPVKTTTTTPATTSSTQVTTTTSTTTTTTTTTKTPTAPPLLVDFMYSKFYDGNFLCTSAVPPLLHLLSSCNHPFHYCSIWCTIDWKKSTYCKPREQM